MKSETDWKKENIKEVIFKTYCARKNNKVCMTAPNLYES